MTEMDPKEALQAEFGDVVQDVVEFRGDLTIVVDSDRIVDVCRYCRDTKELAYNFLSSVAGVDYFPQSPRFAIVYHMYSMTHNRALGLKVFLDDDEPTVPSVTDLYPTADWHEREIFDLFGVVFTGHPDLRRILMPDNWDGHPLRKDYPLGYETVQFSFNYDEVDRYKPYAQE
jgi:NADH-quinone oxidoreductase subunit C